MPTEATYVIAEAGVNHNGSLDLARHLIDVAADAGADAVKFQTFRADALTTKATPKATYQRETTDAAESQHAMLKALELSESDHDALVEHCQTREIQFLSTPFDTGSLAFLVDRFDMPRVKVPSGEITNGPIVLAAARTGRPVILSTGMATLGEIEQALGVLAFGYTAGCHVPPSLGAFGAAYASDEGQEALRARVTVLHCTTAYPTSLSEVNLRAMDTIRDAFGLAVGYSDHTVGVTVPIAAVARGATLIEKHFTTDRSLPGPDHRASLEPGELAEMVRSIRDVETALGSGTKTPTATELDNRSVGRKSLTAATPIAEGQVLTDHNVTAQRPGTGLSPMHYWDRLGELATRHYETGELL